MDVFLINKGRRRLTGSYNHSVVCANGTCMCVEAVGVSDTGRPVPTVVERSYDIPAKCKSGPYPPEILLVPQVQVALKAGTLRKEVPLAKVQKLGGGE